MIELLYDRVEYHKDKIIAPILLSEMRAMEVKKNGKVEHSNTTHDDQVFSWLMALYVWYDGENLAERYNIRKNTLKTDEEEELFDTELDEQLTPKESIMLEKFQDVDPDDSHTQEILAAYQFIEDNKPIITSAQFKDQTELADIAQRNMLLMTNKNAKEAYCRQYGIDPKTIGDNSGYSGTVQIPDFMFNINDDNINMFGMNDDPNDPNQVLNSVNGSPLVGNLSQYWDQV